MRKSSDIQITDQFCGAGGSSLAARATGATVRMALNHWARAIETHQTNFPEVQHDCTDISACNPKRYPATHILVTSPECTNHSVAGGKPRCYYQQDLFGRALLDPSEERSRATMWDVPRFAEVHRYEIIIVENVVDARQWRLFDAWLHAMQLLEYEHRLLYLNSMMVPPTPQSRDRMYMVFWKRRNTAPNLDIFPAAFCASCQREVAAQQRWKKLGSPWGKYQRQYRYHCPSCHEEVIPRYTPAATAIDWSLPIERIGERKKPLKPRTLARIEAGLRKFGRQFLTVSLEFGNESHHARPVTKPLPTQTTCQALGIVIPSAFQPQSFITSYYSGSNVIHSVDEPFGTVTTQDRHALVIPTKSLNVNDCGFRMIRPHEVQRAMAFPDNYVVLGSQREKVKQLGNAVTPPVMQLILQRCLATL